MVSLREKVNVEMENISIVLEELKKTKDKDKVVIAIDHLILTTRNEGLGSEG